MQPPNPQLQGELNTKVSEFAQKCANINGRLNLWQSVRMYIFETLTEYNSRINLNGKVHNPMSNRVSYEIPFADYFPASTDDPGNFWLHFEINGLGLINVSGYNPMDSYTIQLSDYPIEPHILKEKEIMGYFCKYMDSLNLYLSKYSEIEK